MLELSLFERIAELGSWIFEFTILLKSLDLSSFSTKVIGTIMLGLDLKAVFYILEGWGHPSHPVPFL